MTDRDIWNNRAPGRLGALSAISQIAAQWPTNAIPGRTREERAAAETASIIAPNAEAMRVELALERDRSAVASMLARAKEIAQDAKLAKELLK